jgi:hypothetical protein
MDCVIYRFTLSCVCSYHHHHSNVSASSLICYFLYPQYLKPGPQ